MREMPVYSDKEESMKKADIGLIGLAAAHVTPAGTGITDTVRISPISTGTGTEQWPIT